MAQLLQWTPQQKAEFLEFQFNAQRTHYREHFSDASYAIIERSRTAIGRLYVATLAEEVRLMDVALLAEVRNCGIGGWLCQRVVEKAQENSKIVSLHVEDNNPAKRLYERLGFVTVADVSFYELMHWIPKGQEHKSAVLVDQLKTAS